MRRNEYVGVIYIHNIKANYRKQEDIVTERVSTGVNDVMTLNPNWMGYETKKGTRVTNAK